MNKKCNRCKIDKDSALFYKNKSRKDGLHHTCRECDHLLKSSYYLADPDGYRKKKRVMYAKIVARDKNYNRKKHIRERDSLSRRYSDYKKRAAKLEIEFGITQEEFEILTSKKCEYCGQHTKGKKFSGLDRLNSGKGYTTDNVVPCCKVCNYFKRELAKTDFLEHVVKIYKYSCIKKY